MHHFYRVSLLFIACLLVSQPASAASQTSGVSVWLLVIVQLLIIGFLCWLLVQKNSRSRTKSALNHDQLPETSEDLKKARQQLYREITRHEATVELLHETQEYMNCMINSMPTVLIGITIDGYVTHWNHSAEKAANLSSDEAIGSHLSQAFPDLPVTMEMISETIKTGIPLTQESVRDGSGSQATYTDITLYPLKSEDLVGAVVMAEDVTPRVRMENLLIQNEKMMSLGELAAGVAHEINNPLAGILSNAQNISRRIDSELATNRATAEKLSIDFNVIAEYLQQREIPQFIQNIRQAGERAATIVNNLLEFSRGSDRNQQPTDLSAVVINTLELARNNFELLSQKNAELPEVKTHFETGLKPVFCSAPEIQQVLLNLMRNAAQAFATEGFTPQQPPSISIKLFQSEDYAVIEIADNGPGMNESTLSHIFEPFYTTKAVGQGTGLGLSVSYFIIKEHHQGSISAESTLGEGTTFKIKLPFYNPPGN